MTARHDDDSSSGGGFVLGMVTGAALGAALAMLFAPKAGAEVRQDLAGTVGDLSQVAKDKWADVTTAADSAMDKGREAYGQARGTVQQAADTANQSIDRAKDVVNDVKQAARQG
jgi:gas vesicle protein